MQLKRLQAQNQQSLLNVMEGDAGPMTLEKICQKISCWYVRREEIASVRAEGVYEIVPMQECKDEGKKLLDLIRDGHRQVCGPTSKEIVLSDLGWTQRSLWTHQSPENSIETVPGNARRRGKAKFRA